LAFGKNFSQTPVNVFAN